METTAKLDNMKFAVVRYVEEARQWVTIAAFTAYPDAMMYQKIAQSAGIVAEIVEL